MSRQRRNFSAKFKSNLVIELLKGELNNLGLIEPPVRCDLATLPFYSEPSFRYG